MKHLLKNESASKSTTCDKDANVVHCVHATVHQSLGKGERFEMIWAIDFADMSNEKIMEAAAEYFIIKIRRTFSKIDKPESSDWDNVTFKAVDFITTRQSKTDKLAEQLANFSDDDLAALGLSRS